MNETKVEEILNQYQSKHTYIVPTVVAELWTLHRICLPRSYLANHHYIIMIITIAIFKISVILMIMIAPWKPEVDFAACDSSPILMFYPLVPRTQDLWILSSFLPALIIPWSTIWPNHNDPRWSPQRATMWSYDLMIQDERWKSHLLRPVPPGHLRHRPSSTSFAPVLIVTIVSEIWGKQ